MNLTAMTAEDLRELALRLINAADLADIIGAPVDLTATTALISLPIFPPAGVLTAGSETTEISLLDKAQVVLTGAKEIANVSAETKVAPFILSDKWTEAEDQIVIAGAVEFRNNSVSHASKMIAARLPGRTAGATAFRMNKQLREAINAAKADAEKDTAPVEAEQPAENPVSDPAPVPANPSPVVVPLSAMFPIDQALTARHKVLRAALNALGYADGWSPKADADLCEMLGKGWKVGAIAELFERPVEEVRARWSALAAAARDGSETLSIEGQACLATETRDRAQLAGA